MASTYSSNFKLEKMATGANANTWGTRTNNNLDVLDAFGAGYLAKSVAGAANITLTTGDADPSTESANRVIELTGALTGDITVFVPAVESEYVFFNNTTGSQTLTIAATGHAANGIVIAQTAYSHIYCEGASNYKIYNSLDKLGATTFEGAVTAGDGNIILRTNGAIAATTYTGDGSNLTGVEPFPSGTKQVFYQASAPTGWTQDTAAALGNAAMRVVTGTGGGTGGSDTFQTTFGSSRSTETANIGLDVAPTTVDASSVSLGDTTLSTPTIAAHTHPTTDTPKNGGNYPNGNSFFASPPSNPTGAVGGGGSHGHPMASASGSVSGTENTPTSFSVPTMDIKFANAIVCSKD